MNPVFKHNEKSFSWNYSEDSRVYSFKIVPYDQEMYSGLKVLLSKAIFESASQYSFSRHKVHHRVMCSSIIYLIWDIYNRKITKSLSSMRSHLIILPSQVLNQKIRMNKVTKTTTVYPLAHSHINQFMSRKVTLASVWRTKIKSKYPKVLMTRSCLMKALQAILFRLANHQVFCFLLEETTLASIPKDLVKRFHFRDLFKMFVPWITNPLFFQHTLCSLIRIRVT